MPLITVTHAPCTAVETLEHCFCYNLDMLLLIKTMAHIMLLYAHVLQSILYLKYQILSKQEVFEKVFKC